MEKPATLEQTAISPDSIRLAEKAVMVNKSMRSAKIEGPDTIILRPDWAKAVKPKSGRAHFEPEITNGHEPIPDGAVYLQYPSYHKSGNRFIDYGRLVCYDEQGNKIGY